MLLAVLTLVCGCSPWTQAGSIDRPAANVTAAEMQMITEKSGMIQAGDVVRLLNRDADLVLIDVRSPEEHRERHIPGSLNYPLESLEEIPAQYRQSILVVYCESGVRAGQAVEILGEMGYEQVYNLGGLDNWPYETITLQ